MLIKNSITARETVPMGDVNNLPSATEPDQTLSIKQLIERHAQGINLGVKEYDPIYSDQEDFPNVEYMDFHEAAEYRDFLANERYKLEERLKQLEKDKKELQSRPAPTPQRDTDAGGTRPAPEA